MARTLIDRSKLRAAIRKMGDEYVFSMLDVAIDLLSEAQLFKLAKQHLDPSTLGRDGHEKGNLLADVRASVTARRRRCGHTAHLTRGFSQMPRTHSFAHAGA